MDLSEQALVLREPVLTMRGGPLWDDDVEVRPTKGKANGLHVPPSWHLELYKSIRCHGMHTCGCIECMMYVHDQRISQDP